ncbi:unnamed protein product [Hymenolepis diminuta]|uniref:SAM domain-containing protein n=1 Tax=Hymenolepis diminuta TaxID=6216 RepID=A0A0R3SVK1_HYMDI|nr:unnamed protein product [Hymenolepis diminuta]
MNRLLFRVDRRRPIDNFRTTPRPDDVFWSPPESHMYQNTRMLDSPLDTMDTRGQRTGPGNRHRPKDLQKLDEEGYPLHPSNSRQQEPPIPRRQWNPEDPNRSLPRDVSLEVEKAKSRFPPHSAQEEKRWQRSEDLIDTALRTKIPFAVWNAATVVAWLEHWVGMPAWYVAACRANITSGGMIASLSDQEVQRELGISNPLHRLKLRVAVQEMIAYTSNPGTATSNAGTSGIAPIDLPLLQYRRQFMECLVDGRMLEHLTKRDLRVHLKVVDGFHRLSIQCGIALLKRFNYDIDAIEERRLACLNKDTDLIVWTNDRVTNWLTTLGILDTNISLDQSGLHGAVLALDAEMDTPTLATVLQIPNSNIEARLVFILSICRKKASLELLEYHLFNLVKPYRSLRLSYINLDNPAFTSDEREDYPWENEEVGMEVEDPTGGYKESTPQRGGGPPLTDASYSSSSVGKSIPPSSSSAKGHIH